MLTSPDARPLYLAQRQEQGVRWFTAVADVFKRHGCDWGGDWRQKDYPHMQWGKLKPMPSDRAREILRVEGMAGVWRAVGAV